MAMVERGGRVKTQALPDVTAKNLLPHMIQNISPTARIMTDEHRSYQPVGQHFAGGHDTVCHSRKEYARGDVTTNTVEGFFSLLKRGIYGTFHSVSRKHLHRYAAEFEFRYNTRSISDGERVAAVIRAADGKRLMYREPVKN
jgi:transposase-like protein